MRIVTRMTLVFMLGALCAAGIAACSSDEQAGPVGPSPITEMSEGARDSAAHVVPGGTANGGSWANEGAGDTDGTWQNAGGEGGIRNASDSATTHTNGLSASHSLFPQVEVVLVVESPRVSDSDLVPGDAFTFAVTVRNSGPGPSPAVPLQFYMELPDGSIRSLQGSDVVPRLQPSGRTSHSITLTARFENPRFYACVKYDRLNPSEPFIPPVETCSDAVEVRAGNRAVLVVKSPRVSTPPDNSELGPGDAFTFAVTVHNIGSGPSAEVPLQYYMEWSGSTIRSIRGSDVVPRLQPSGSSSHSITLTLPSFENPRFYACVEYTPPDPYTPLVETCSDAVGVGNRAVLPLVSNLGGIRNDGNVPPPSNFNKNLTISTGMELGTASQVYICAWDHGRIDGDRIRLVFGNRTLGENISLPGPQNPASWVLNVTSGYYYRITATALNEGSIPPNTGTIAVSRRGCGSYADTIEWAAPSRTNGTASLTVFN